MKSNPAIVKQTRTDFYELGFKLFDVTCLNKVLYFIVDGPEIAKCDLE